MHDFTAVGFFQQVAIDEMTLITGVHSRPQIEYNNVLSLHDRVLEVTVKSKKSFVGATNIFLGERKMEVEEWYPLGNCPI